LTREAEYIITQKSEAVKAFSENLLKKAAKTDKI